MTDDAAERGQARAELAKLEHDPKHTTPPAEHDRSTRAERLDDPARQKPHKLDPGWTTGPDGHPYHPDFES
jgi:hypothetical protein